MSQIHILESDGNGVYRAVLHGNTPAGNNGAGVAWSTVLVNAGLAVTVLPEGAGPGQITTVEKSQVLAGALMEVVTRLRVESGGGGAASIDDMAATALTAARQEFTRKYNRFGAARG